MELQRQHEIEHLVSRETMERLKTHEAQLLKWNPAINLVSRSAIQDIWTRHFQDSAQIFQYAPKGEGRWADLGSGGGFPGLVVAAIARDENPGLKVTLVESDVRKATFLQQTAVAMGLDIDVVSQRIELLPSLRCTVLSARALAPLDVLCGYANAHLLPCGVALFPKGRKHPEEISEAKKNWNFHHEIFQSLTDPGSVILALREVEHV